MTLKAGVLAVQGDVSEHVRAIERVAAASQNSLEVVEIRSAGLVPDCELLSMPGGESTTISELLSREGIHEEIQTHVAAGKPLLATCAGLIVAATEVPDGRVNTLDLLDVRIERNAFGRQADSFEAQLSLSGLEDPFHAVFIRAPAIDSVGTEVDVLASIEDRPVAVREGPVVGTAFHPELTTDDRIHELAFASVLQRGDF